MALVAFGSGVSGIRGKIGGSVFSFNNSGAYAKQYARVVKRQSQIQVYFRQRLAQLPYLWTSSSQAIKDTWIAYAASPSELDYDPWGVQRYLSGYQWFIRANMRLWYWSEATAVNAPVTPAPTAIPGLSLTLHTPGDGDCVINYTGDPFSASEGIAAELAFSRSEGRIYPETPWHMVYSAPDPGAGPLDISLGVALNWGLVPVGWQGHLRAWNQSNTGVRSVIATATALVEEP